MEYHVTVTPKYIRHVPEPEIPSETELPEPEEVTPQPISPKTGDEMKIGNHMIFGMISFTIVLIMSCHNRFKCGRMSE